jgi:hypothetical protein
MKPNPNRQGGDFVLIKLKTRVPLLQDYVFAPKHPRPFLEDSMQLIFNLETKYHEAISSCGNILKTIGSPCPRCNGVDCVEWHTKPWEKSNHAAVPLFRIIQEHCFCDLEVTTYRLSRKWFQSESGAGVRDSNFVCP